MTLHLSQIFFTDARTFIEPLHLLDSKHHAALTVFLSITRIQAKEKIGLLIPVDDSTSIEVIRTEFNRDPVARQDADEIFTHSPGHMSQGLMFVLEFHLE